MLFGLKLSSALSFSSVVVKMWWAFCEKQVEKMAEFRHLVEKCIHNTLTNSGYFFYARLSLKLAISSAVVSRKDMAICTSSYNVPKKEGMNLLLREDKS